MCNWVAAIRGMGDKPEEEVVKGAFEGIAPWRDIDLQAGMARKKQTKS